MPDLSKSAKNPKQAFVQATPRNAFLGMLSDALAQTYAPQRTQQMQGVANFLSVPAIADTLNRLSYGEPLTTGSGGIGGTTRLRPEALEAALAISPFLPKGARLTEGLPVGASIKDINKKFVYPGQEALDLAQKRAALPVEQGGLGLPANNTAADRAAAMGFDTDTFHGTDYDILELDKSFLGSNTAANSAKKGFFSAGHPRTTYAYIDNGVTGTDAVMSFIHGKSFDQLEKDLAKYAASKNLKPHQVRDEFYDNLPNKYKESLKFLQDKKLSILKELPVKKIVMGRRFPDMDKASPEQLKTLSNIDDSIEELNAMASMVMRSPALNAEIDDMSEISKNLQMVGANIIPLKIKGSNANVYDDMNAGFRQDTFANRMDESIRDKRDLAIIKNTQDGFKSSDTIYGVINPDVVRSRFAAFDPWRKDAATAAAFGVAAPNLLAADQNQGQNGNWFADFERGLKNYIDSRSK